MSSLTRLFVHNPRVISKRIPACITRYNSSQTEEKSSAETASNENDEEFRVLNLRPVKARPVRKQYEKEELLPPRANKMPVDQDWGAVWPGPRSFHPATVPLPLRQGYTQKGAAAPGKFANAELMKIPNFLHLTPPVIKKQCEALKKFCTPWPKGLETEEKWKKHFPIDVITTGYCHGLPTIRNPLARIVTLRMKLSTLKFDKHSKDKFLRLVGDRYNEETDILTLVTDRCPLRKQNYDYAQYLLTALYHESWTTEPWEASKSEADMEYYDFNRNQSKVSAESILKWGKPEDTKVEIPPEFKTSVENLINEGENEINLTSYKNEVTKLLDLPEFTRSACG